MTYQKGHDEKTKAVSAKHIGRAKNKQIVLHMWCRP